MSCLDTRRAIWSIAFSGAVLSFSLAACGGSNSDSPAGDMGDTSYYGQRGVTSRPNATGRMVSLDQFAGRFIWADYAAPWCSPCVPQSRTIRSLTHSGIRDVVFLTVMTSEMGGYGHPPTTDTAARWASRFGLDPEMVLAADLTAMTIPKHILFSPEGHVLFERTGQLGASHIRETLSRFKEDWRRWKEFGTTAEWMR